MTPIADKRFYRPDELASEMRITVETVRRWVREKRIEHVHLLRGIRISREEFLFVLQHGPRPRPMIR